jgi:protein-tyrosine phosphatase
MSDPTKLEISRSNRSVVPEGDITDPRSQRMRGVTAHGNMPFDVPFISEVGRNLWQGGCTNGLVLPEIIKYVVSLYPWERYTVNHELKGELYYRAYDSVEQDISNLMVIADLVRNWRAEAPVLVHCQAGLNRSSVVAALVLIGDEVQTGAEAINLLREKRSPAVLCNPAFERAINDIESYWDWH